jgi:hypothetical protein
MILLNLRVSWGFEGKTVGTLDRGGACPCERFKKGLPHDGLAGDRVLALNGFKQVRLIDQTLGDLTQAIHHSDVVLALERGVQPNGVGEGVKVNDTVETRANDLVKQF